jgi:AraC-like DNA-binding protein
MNTPGSGGIAHRRSTDPDRVDATLAKIENNESFQEIQALQQQLKTARTVIRELLGKMQYMAPWTYEVQLAMEEAEQLIAGHQTDLHRLFVSRVTLTTL